MKIALITAAVLSVASAAEAGDYMLLTANENAASYTDVRTIEHDRDFASIRVYSAQMGKSDIAMVETLYEFDCKAEYVRMREVLNYDENGVPEFNRGIETYWMRYSEFTPLYIARRLACEGFRYSDKILTLKASPFEVAEALRAGLDK